MTRIWTINGRFLSQRLTGVQRYAREIVRALDREVTEHHPATHDLDLRLVVPRDAREPIDLTAIRRVDTDRDAGYLWEQVTLPRHTRGGLLSLGNVGPVAIRRQILCLHDMSTRTCPGSYATLYRRAQAVMQPILARRVAGLTTVSEASAAEIVRHGLCRRSKLRVIANGHEHALAWTPRHSAATRAAAGPTTIVMLGSPAPHKNVRLILDMADQLIAQGFRIAVVGAADGRVFQGGRSEASPAVQWLGRVSDDEIAALLRDSLCLAFPSLTEGFGLPPLEAMALGCPVVASDRASLPEICGNAALYAAPTDPQAWLRAFVRLRDEPGRRTDLIARGRQQASRFSWRTSARQYLHAMAAADGLATATHPRASDAASAPSVLRPPADRAACEDIR